LYQDDRTGSGIRPAPYSCNMEIQPFTYDRIKTNGWITGGSLAIPHGVGHGWAAVLWDMAWDLVERHGFNPNVDAIIAADQLLTGGDNECLLWSSFARRGPGFSAVQGTTNRDDDTEAFDGPPGYRAPGSGLVGAQTQNPPAVNTQDAGSVVPVDFDVGGDLGLDVLKPSHSPASQQIDCGTGQPVQFAVTTPTSGPDDTGLKSKPAPTALHVPVGDGGVLGGHLPAADRHAGRRLAAPRHPPSSVVPDPQPSPAWCRCSTLASGPGKTSDSCPVSDQRTRNGGPPSVPWTSRISPSRTGSSR
jgi:Fungalysin metallopeptidase (M36)